MISTDRRTMPAKTRQPELRRRCQNCRQPFRVKNVGKAHTIGTCGKCRHQRRK